MRAGFRDSAIMVWTLERMIWISEKPNPDELPVTSQVSDFAADVSVNALFKSSFAMSLLSD